MISINFKGFAWAVGVITLVLNILVVVVHIFVFAVKMNFYNRFQAIVLLNISFSDSLIGIFLII